MRFAIGPSAVIVTILFGCSELAATDEEVIGRDCSKLPPVPQQRCFAVRTDCALISAGQVDEAKALIDREYANRLRLCRGQAAPK